jgi:hypothetical protein
VRQQPLDQPAERYRQFLFCHLQQLRYLLIFPMARTSPSQILLISGGSHRPAPRAPAQNPAARGAMTAPTASFETLPLIIRRARAARSRGLGSAAARSLSSVRPRCKISRGAGHNREHSPLLGLAK